VSGQRGRRLGDWRNDPSLTSVDRAMLERIEALYGPSPQPQPAEGARALLGSARKRVEPLGRSILRTLLFVSAAFLAWYALAGRQGSVQETIALVVARTGPQPQSGSTQPEYLLATRTMHVDRLAADDPLVRQFKTVLDQLGPKCRETRTQLANSTIAAHDSLQARGIDLPYLSILAQLDASLPDQTRGQWPANCQDLIAKGR